jgi:hypothetical protein
MLGFWCAVRASPVVHVEILFVCASTYVSANNSLYLVRRSVDSPSPTTTNNNTYVPHLFRRQIGTSILKSIPKILDVLILLLLTILLFALVGFLMLSGVTGTFPAIEAVDQSVGNDTCNFVEGYDMTLNATNFDPFVPYCSTWGGRCRDYFNSVAHSFMHLFILISNANYPEVMIPCVRACARCSAVVRFYGLKSTEPARVRPALFRSQLVFCFTVSAASFHGAALFCDDED